MTSRLLVALLASAIVAGCSKDESLPGAQPLSSFLVLTAWDYTSHEFELVKFNLDGTGKSPFIDQVFSADYYYKSPDITASGDKIVYVSNDSVYLMDIFAKTRKFVYKHNNPDNPDVLFLAVSRDGSKIAFSACPGQSSDRIDVFVMDAIAGSTPVNISNSQSGFRSYHPSFSTDMAKVTYSRQNYDASIYVYDLQGHNEIRVSETHTGDNVDSDPVFSKDGSNIIFTTNNYGSYAGPFDLALSGATSGGESSSVRLTDIGSINLSSATLPTISKDGQTIYFIGSNKAGEDAIYKIPYQGGGVAVRVADLLPYASHMIVGLHFVEQ